MAQYDVVLKGAYGAANLGDDLLLLSALKFLNIHRNGLRIAVLTKPNSYLPRLLANYNVDYIYKNESRHVRINKIVWGGGTQIYNFGGRDLLFKKIYAYLKKPSLMAQRLGLKQPLVLEAGKEIMLGVGLGPFSSRANESSCLGRLNEFERVLVRDQLSYDYAIARMDEHQLYKIHDLCLIDSASYEQKSETSGEDTLKKVGIILRDWRYSSSVQAHVQRVLKFCEEFDEYDYTFFFLGNDVYCKKVVGEKYKTVCWDPEQSCDYLSFLAAMKAMDCIISSRFHGLIFSIILNIPAVAVEIEDKISQAKLAFYQVLEGVSFDFAVEELKALLTKQLARSRSEVEALCTSIKENAQKDRDIVIESLKP